MEAGLSTSGFMKEDVLCEFNMPKIIFFRLELNNFSIMQRNVIHFASKYNFYGSAHVTQNRL